MPSSKPDKPYPGFPLFAHATGRWAKKIRNKTEYFGPWGDPQAALRRYLEQKDDLFAGRVPRRHGEVTVKLLVNTFLTSKKRLVDAGDMSPRTLLDYEATCQHVAKSFGSERLVSDLRPEDFEILRAEIAAIRSPHTLGNQIQTIRSVFRYGYEAGLLEQPMRFGPGFRRPSKKSVRLARSDRGLRMFEAEELRTLLDGIKKAPFKAMVLLGINCGFGNADCGRLPLSALDLDAGWVRFPRPKTGIDRRAKLWPETVMALRVAIAKRKEPASPDLAGLVFITQFGTCYAKDTKENPISKRMTAALQALGIHRQGLDFYALRHTFRTIADETRDRPAVDLVMGHTDDSMAAAYRERIGDERLVAVAEHVRGWLFGASSAELGRKQTHGSVLLTGR